MKTFWIVGKCKIKVTSPIWSRIIIWNFWPFRSLKFEMYDILWAGFKTEATRWTIPKDRSYAPDEHQARSKQSSRNVQTEKSKGNLAWSQRSRNKARATSQTSFKQSLDKVRTTPKQINRNRKLIARPRRRSNKLQTTSYIIQMSSLRQFLMRVLQPKDSKFPSWLEYLESSPREFLKTAFWVISWREVWKTVLDGMPRKFLNARKVLH